MKSNKRLLGAGVVSALLASLCCVAPLLMLVAGGSSIASSLTWLEPARPFFIALTLGVLVFAWYQKLRKPKTVDDCGCEVPQKKRFLQSTVFLSIMTVLVLGMLAFPYYSTVFYPTSTTAKIPVNSATLQTAYFGIEGMTCSSCEAHVNLEVNKIEGVFQITTSYDDKQAVVDYDTTVTTQAEIVKAIEKTGYRVTNTPD